MSCFRCWLEISNIVRLKPYAGQEDTAALTAGASVHSNDGVTPDTPCDDDDKLEEEATSAIQKALDELQFMATAIRRSSFHRQKYNLSSHFHRDDDSYFQQHACLLVRHFFPDARRSLSDQLGTSLAIRRQRFFQRMRHEQKLSVRRRPAESEVSPVQVPVAQVDKRPANLPKQKKIVPIRAPPRSADTGSRLDSVAVRRHQRHGPALSVVSMGSSVRLPSMTYPEKPKFNEGDKQCVCPYCARPLKSIQLKNEPNYWQ